MPEDWVASTTTLFSEPDIGLTRLPDGELLVDAVQRDPVGWLGSEHVEAFGTDTSLLVKLGPVRTGLTAILPRPDGLPVYAGRPGLQPRSLR